MPLFLPGVIFSMLPAMGVVLAGWGGYWLLKGSRPRAAVMVVIGLGLMLAAPVGLNLFHANFFARAAAVTLAVGGMASAAEIWLRSQRSG